MPSNGKEGQGMTVKVKEGFCMVQGKWRELRSHMQLRVLALAWAGWDPIH
jgi:hypothetical protein